MADGTAKNPPCYASTSTSPASSTSASPLSPFISNHSVTSSEATTADGDSMIEAAMTATLKRECVETNGPATAAEAGLHHLRIVNKDDEDRSDTPVAELNKQLSAKLYHFTLPESALPLSFTSDAKNAHDRIRTDGTPASSVSTSILSSVPSSPSTSFLAGSPTEGGLLPPANFSLVAPGVYRSAFPNPANFAFLDTLGLKTVCVLVQEPYPAVNEQWRQSRGIRLLQFGIPGHKEAPMPPAVIEQALLAVLDKRNHPMLIHCNKGKHRTGCVVGCLRRLQQWTVEKSIEEYCTFSHPKSRAADQAFVTAFELERIQQSIAGSGREWLPDWFEGEDAREANVEEVVGDLEDGS